MRRDHGGDSAFEKIHHCSVMFSLLTLALCGPPHKRLIFGFLAEAVRFELTNPCGLPVFKTGAIDHSATLPSRVF